MPHHWPPSRNKSQSLAFAGSVAADIKNPPAGSRMRSATLFMHNEVNARKQLYKQRGVACRIPNVIKFYFILLITWRAVVTNSEGVIE